MKTPLHVVLLASVSLVVTLPLVGCSGGVTDHHTAPITVSVSPTTASLAAGGTQQFTATVTGTSSTAVTWSCSGTGCGTITATGMYTAPASIPTEANVTVVATLQSDGSKSASATVHHVASPRLIAGDYAFVFNGWEQASATPGRQSIVGRFHSDGSGNITGGIEDINSISGVSLAVPFTGTYTVGSDRQGTLTISTATNTVTYAMVVDSTGAKANFNRFDTSVPGLPVSGEGYLEAQDINAVSQSSVAGPYALSLTAKPGEFLELVAIGRMTVDAAGALSGGVLDLGGGVAWGDTRELAGSMTGPSSGTGRGTAVLTVNFLPGMVYAENMNFVYYVVSANKLLLLQTDTRGDTVTDFSGEARRQTGTYSVASLNAPVIFRAQGTDQSHTSAAIGRISPGGDGTLAVVRDQNFGSTVSLDASFTGSYAVEASGRSTMTLGDTFAIAYLFGQNQGYLLYSGLSGSFKPQSSGPFSNTSIAATYRHAELDATSMFSECDIGTTTFTSGGTLTGAQNYTFFTMDWTTYAYVARSQTFSGTYTTDTRGRGVISLVGYDGLPLVFWVVSPDEIITLDTAGVADSLPALLQYLK